MVLWLGAHRGGSLMDLIARKNYARAVEVLREQLRGRRPGPQMRLQLADLLVLAGRASEAVPVLLGLADEFASDGFVAKAVAILKRIEKIEPGRMDVERRLAALVIQQHRGPPAPAPSPPPPRMLEIGIEEICEEPLEPAPAAAAPSEPLEPPARPAEEVVASPPAEEAPPSSSAGRAASAAPTVEAGPASAAVSDVEPASAEGPSEVPPRAPIEDAGPRRRRFRGVLRRFLAALGAAESEPAGAEGRERIEGVPPGDGGASDEAVASAETLAAAAPRAPEPAAQGTQLTLQEDRPEDVEGIAEEPAPDSGEGQTAGRAEAGHGVANRLRGVLRRFLASLPGTGSAEAAAISEEPGGEGEASPAAVAGEVVVEPEGAITEVVVEPEAEPTVLGTEELPRGPGASEAESEPEPEVAPSAEPEPRVVAEVGATLVEAAEPEPASWASEGVSVEADAEEEAILEVASEPAVGATEEPELELEVAPCAEAEPAYEEDLSELEVVPDETPGPETAPVLEAGAGEPKAPAQAALEPAPEGAAHARDFVTMSEEAFHEKVLDLIEDLLREPPPEGQAAVVAGPVGPGPDEPPLYGFREVFASPLFADLTERELMTVVRGLQLLTLDPGDIIVTEGERGDSLLVVASGTVKVFVRNPDGRNFEVGRLGEGEFFGELSSLSGRPRSATVTAAGPCELLELDRATLEQIARTHPRVCDLLESVYIERASSPEVAAVRAVALDEAETHRRAIEVLEAHFGESRWDPRMRLRLADVLLKAGKDQEAVPVLIGLADDLAREGLHEKAIAILKKIEQVRRRQIREVRLAPLRKGPRDQEQRPASGDAGRQEKEAASSTGKNRRAEGPVRARPKTEVHLEGWLVEIAREAARRRASAPEPAGLERRSPPGFRRGLMASPLFEGFSEEELLAFIRGLRLAAYEPGDIILTEGERGECVFIVATGAVKVSIRSPAGRSVSLCDLGEGSFFGEISMLSGRPRTATVTAAAPCELLQLDRASLEAIAGAHPRVREVLEQLYIERATSEEAASIRTAGPS